MPTVVTLTEPPAPPIVPRPFKAVCTWAAVAAADSVPLVCPPKLIVQLPAVGAAGKAIVATLCKPALYAALVIAGCVLGESAVVVTVGTTAVPARLPPKTSW